MKTEFNPELNFTSKVLYTEPLHKGFSSAYIALKTGTVQEKINADRFVKSIKYLIDDNKKNFYEIEMAPKHYEPEYRCYLCKNGSKITMNEKTNKGGINVMELIIDYVTKDLKQTIKGSIFGTEERLAALKGNKKFGETL